MLHKLERRPELDALRGLFLVWMTLTHLPTRFSDFVNQPVGFVSSAEGFVFISALLVGRLYIRELVQDPSNVRIRLWKRSLQDLRLSPADADVCLYSRGGLRSPYPQSGHHQSPQFLSCPSASWPLSARCCCSIARLCSTFCPCTSRFFSLRRWCSRRQCALAGAGFSRRAPSSGYWRSSDCATWPTTGSCI